MSECYLERTYSIDHTKIPELYTRQYYSIGKLFPHQKICSYCLIKLEDAIKVLDIQLAMKQHFVNVDLGDPEVWRKRNPAYAKVVDDVGVATLKFELTKNLFEHPYEAKLTETMDRPLRIVADDGETRSMVPDESPKRPKVTVD